MYSSLDIKTQIALGETSADLGLCLKPHSDSVNSILYVPRLTPTVAPNMMLLAVRVSMQWTEFLEVQARRRCHVAHMNHLIYFLFIETFLRGPWPICVAMNIAEDFAIMTQ
jgi:hypothetical protein